VIPLSFDLAIVKKGNEDNNNNAPVLLPFKQPFAKNVHRTPLEEFVICFLELSPLPGYLCISS